LAHRFARNLLKRRKELLLTQADLAERLGVATETVSRFERARHLPSLKMLERMAGALRIPIADLIGDAPLLPAIELDQSRLTAALDGLDDRDRELVAATVEHLSQQLRRRRRKH
jgi:transcriptional regulator with XRE-family HTH domain